MHKSIAKAKRKGDLRNVSSVQRNWLNSLDSGTVQISLTKKSLTALALTLRSNLGTGLIAEFKQASRSSWHFITEYLAMDVELNEFDGTGGMYPVFIERLDTKALTKAKSRAERSLGYSILKTPYAVHEHFIDRVIQRTVHGSLKNALNIIYDTFLLLNSVDLSLWRRRSGQLIIKDKVIILAPGPFPDSLVFKTILINAEFSDRQHFQFDGALRLINQGRADGALMFEHENDFIMLKRSKERSMVKLLHIPQ